MNRIRIWVFHKTFFFPFWVMDHCRCRSKARGCWVENLGWRLYRLLSVIGWDLAYPPKPTEAHGYLVQAFNERGA